MSSHGQQFEPFKAELEYAYENVQFYKKHLDNADLSPSDIQSVSDTLRIPHTEKKDYRKNFPLGVFAKGYNPNSPGLTRSQSSGTTGERLITFEVGMLLLARAMDCISVNEHVEEAFSRSPRAICRYAAPNCSDVECANPNSTMEDRLLSDNTLVLPVYHDLLTTSETLIDRALEEIIIHQPDFYYVDPTHFAFLLRHAKEKQVTLPPAAVVTTYTGLNQLCRRQINDYFGAEAPIAELMSCTEMGWIAMGCPHGNLHLNTDSFFMEFIRNGRYAEPGEVGELFISSVDNGALPHLRYKTGDAFKVLAEPCPCGHPTPVASMEGRLINFIVQDGLRCASPKDIDQVVGAPDWLDVYQLHQIDEKNFSFKMMVNDRYQAAAEAEIIAGLTDLLAADSQIVVDIVPYIATERSGKFQYAKSDVAKGVEQFKDSP